MNKKSLVAGMGAVLAAGSLVLTLPSASASTASEPAQKPTPAVVRLCPNQVSGDQVSCQALRLVLPKSKTLAGPPGGALTPAKLQDAYKLTGLQSGGATVAIVDAFGYPNLERDLGVFRDFFGLSPCTTKNGCLTIVNQRGGKKLPPFNLGWAGEQALDVDTVSAACPDCKILVVQGNHSNFPSLGKAVAYAASQRGVVAVSNSYSGHDARDGKWGTYYHQLGVALTASTGDSGFTGAGYPAASRWVTAVGGTSLTTSTNQRGWTESAWGGAGSGCSRFNPAVKGSGPFDTGCAGMRAESDVSAAASPGQGGMAWYGPSSEQTSGWGQVGGTSESSPIIASVYALSGNTKKNANRIPYQNPDHLYDITTGQNGSSCTPSQLCKARVGWDGPTGLGTPHGVLSF